MAAQRPASAADAVAKQLAASTLQDGGLGDDDGDDGGVRLESADATRLAQTAPAEPVGLAKLTTEPTASSQTQPGTGQAAPEAPPLDTAAASSSAPPTQRPRTWTSTAEIDSAVARPGTVRINVKGAFIVDEDLAGNASSPTSETGEPNRRPSRTGSGGGRAHSPSEAHGTFDIRLPNHHAVVSHIAVDIGGTLAKVVYFSREAQSTEPGGRLNFLSFETDRIDECIDFLLDLKQRHLSVNGSPSSELCVMATGGGAYKYYDRIRKRMGIDVLSEDEMECLIMGLDFFITEIPREVFTYSETDPMHFAAPSVDIYPYMLVNIGSGVSMLKVSGPHDYVRVGGTSLGGGTLWGLLSLLTGARSFDEMLELASRGDNSRVDMLVGDIYGTDYGKIGLKSTAIASSFGKVFRMKHLAESEAEDGMTGSRREEGDGQTNAAGDAGSAAEADVNDYADDNDQGDNMYRGAAYNTRFSAADISRSLLYAISNNIGQIAYLQSQIHNLSSIYFGGSFIQGHPQTMNTLSYAIKFWSKGTKQAYFLRHEGYLGAVGAFLKRQPRNWGRRGSFEGREEMRRGGRSAKDQGQDQQQSSQPGQDEAQAN
ncbi:pantothenate kinase [Ophiostoma piceae UAMH 11346]|uniref:Pantothenate kinase n=1 Tax=Ophiostoma piceae (strain UAMH 11346) TaxID=1262450 RepID=S3CDW7_OPHP1|nr:pantothenate kinase [Ophiostoma piceae UAMH 11346]